uniref:Sm domain-containing protein n=1 Tax=Romanomermis culicivorax TaxID=13658 RepID=A0A915KXK2_ROMCU
MSQKAEFDPISFLYDDEDVEKDIASICSVSEATPYFDTVGDFERHLRTYEPDFLPMVEKLISDKETYSSVAVVHNQSSCGTRQLSKEPTIEVNLAQNLVEREKHRPPLITRRKKTFTNVLTKMMNEDFNGPLFKLCECMRDKTRVKIYLRSRIRIRSILTCFIIAFDKHWNIVASDVNELFHKSKCTRVLRKNRPDDLRKADEIYGPLSKSFQFSSVDSKSNHFEWVNRHVPKLFIRGEHIVLISVQ